MTRSRRILALDGAAVASTIASTVAGTLPASATLSETVAVPTPVLTC